MVDKPFFFLHPRRAYLHDKLHVKDFMALMMESVLSISNTVRFMKKMMRVSRQQEKRTFELNYRLASSWHATSLFFSFFIPNRKFWAWRPSLTHFHTVIMIADIEVRHSLRHELWCEQACKENGRKRWRERASMMASEFEWCAMN